MRVYFAHCIALYGTPQAARDIATLEALGFEVVNPADKEDQVQKVRKEVQGFNATAIGEKLNESHEVMERIFKPLATFKTDALAFRSLPDGRIPAGVAKEVAWARTYGNPIFELPSNVLGRIISVDETREYLQEVGQR